VFRPNPAPLRVLGRRRRGGHVRGAWDEGSIAPVPSSPARVLGDHPTVGASFIDPYQNAGTNPETQRGGTCPWLAGIQGLGKAESAQARATDQVFSWHLLARACKAPRVYRSPLMCEPPSNPTSTLSPAAPFAPPIEVDRPCPIPAHGARISRSAPACLRRGMAVNKSAAGGAPSSRAFGGFRAGGCDFGRCGLGGT
jgi:hypothetical protein